MEIAALRQPPPDLTAIERRRAVDGFADDTLTVCGFAYRNRSISTTRTFAVVVAHIAEMELPPLRELARVNAHVLFELKWQAQFRGLDAAERAAHAAAIRLSNAFFGPEGA